MLWLWAINVRYFEWTGVRYDVCFSAKDQKYLLHSRQIFQASQWVLSTREIPHCAAHHQSCVAEVCPAAPASVYMHACRGDVQLLPGSSPFLLVLFVNN